MDWVVIKAGAPIFDTLHALGVAVTVAHATQRPVEVSDQGMVSRIKCAIPEFPNVEIKISDILPLPTLAQVSALDPNASGKPSLPIANLDGLLATLFTVPGIRAIAVGDLPADHSQRSLKFDKCLKKVTKALSGWQRFIGQNSSDSGDWLQEALNAYQLPSPAIPCIRPKSENDLSVLMTLDPSFCHSLYRPISDGRITRKKNLTVDGARFAPLFAMIGAARSLRGQHVANGLVNLYVPSAKHVVVTADTAAPLLKATRHFSQQAAVCHWLKTFSTGHQLNATWKGLFYQTLQPQGERQSISLERGYFDTEWLTALVDQTGFVLVNFWRSALREDQKSALFEIDNLVECLSEQSLSAWLRHIKDIALRARTKRGANIRPYTIFEMREVIHAMAGGSSLNDLLEPGTGTMRFGHALRQLARVNRGAVQDIVDELDVVQSRDQFIRILRIFSQKCAVADAKSSFIIIPNDDDFKRILAEVERHSVKTIAQLLAALSTLQYAPTRKDKAENSADEANQND